MKTRGFTLIELLAVIIVLVALTLITLPVVSNIINNAESDSELKSAKLYLDGVNLAIVHSNLIVNLNDSTCSITNNGDLNCSGNIIAVNAQNNVPVSGTVTIHNKEVVAITNMKLGNNYYNYSNDEWTSSSESHEPSVCTRGREGSYDTITCGTETFYIMYESNGSITMLAKYNLDVGMYSVEFAYDDLELIYDDIPNPTGIQSSQALGWVGGGSPEYDYAYGTTKFSDSNYWASSVSSYPAYVYNENSTIYQYVEDYKDYLEDLGVTVSEARLISFEEAEDLGCDSSISMCDEDYGADAPEWSYSTIYWTGSASDSNNVWIMDGGGFISYHYSDIGYLGVRPVIVIPSSMVD